LRLVGPKPRSTDVGDGWPVDIPAPMEPDQDAMGGRGERGTARPLVVRVCRQGRKREANPLLLNCLVGGEGKAFGLTPTGPTIRREKPLARVPWTVPQTDTGRRVEDTKARERTLVKELGNLTP
jgi:hypothetical protein